MENTPCGGNISKANLEGNLKTRIGIVGLGRMAQRAYLPVLANLENVDLAVIMSRHPEAVEQLRARYHVPRGVTDLSDFLQQDIQAAVVLTPSPTHFEIVKALLQAGVDVLVEKPATLSSQETALLGELADQGGRILMIAFNRRYAPLYQQAKDLFAGHRVSLCVAEKHRESAVNSSLFHHYYEEAIHMVDLLRWYGGDAQAVSTRSLMKDDKLTNATSVVTFEGNGIGVLAASLEGGGWMERITLHGEGLSVQVDAFRELRVLRGKEDQVSGREMAADWLSSQHIRGFEQLSTHFLDCVQQRLTPRTSALEALRTQLLLEQMVAAGE
jgi:virulence factor